MRDSSGRRWMVFLVLLLSACGEEPTPAPATDSTPTPSVAVEPAPTPQPEATPPPELAPPPEWTPELTPTTSETSADTLERADEAMRSGKLEQGEGNALGLYLSVLESQPDNAAALEGVERIVQALSQRIDAALFERRYADAKATLPVLTKLRPHDAAVAQLKTRVDLAGEIERLLQQAQRQIGAGRLLEPADDNAASSYAAVLKRDPEQPDALAGLARLETDLVGQATVAAEAGDYALSDKLLADAARLHPGSTSVQNAGTQIVEMRQGRAAELMRQAQTAADQGDVARAEQLLGQLERVSAQAQGLDELRQRIEQARVYAGFEPGQTVTDGLASGGSGPTLVVIVAGSFAMGSPKSEEGHKKSEGPQHDVTLRRGFAIGEAEITVAQFRAFVQATGYQSSAQRAGNSDIYDERTGNIAERRGIDWRHDFGGREAAGALPVVHVSWEDAKAYADWLARETGKQYRLPSEAEFEYALRAGSRTRYPWGDGTPSRVIANLTGEKDRSQSRRGWNNGFAGYGDGFWGAAPVRRFEPNGFGLHDSNGNVSEWVEDCWHETYSRAPSDGSAWVNPGCKSRVIRGASWASAPEHARSAFRLGGEPDATNARVGFRVAREL